VSRAPKFHRKCHACGGSQAREMMRPVPNGMEARVAAAMSEPKVEATSYTEVCRRCWWISVKDKKKDELLDLLETVTCDLHEALRILAAVPQVQDDIGFNDDDIPF
jgi:hypothetical protein